MRYVHIPWFDTRQRTLIFGWDRGWPRISIKPKTSAPWLTWLMNIATVRGAMIHMASGDVHDIWSGFHTLDAFDRVHVERQIYNIYCSSCRWWSSDDVAIARAIDGMMRIYHNRILLRDMEARVDVPREPRSTRQSAYPPYKRLSPQQKAENTYKRLRRTIRARKRNESYARLNTLTKPNDESTSRTSKHC